MPNKIVNDLTAHIAKLRAADAKKPKKAKDALLYWGSAADKNYLSFLKPCVGAATVYLKLDKVDTLAQVVMHCKTKGVTRVITSSPTLLAKLLAWDKRKAPSFADYAGSYFTIPIPSTSPLDPAETAYIEVVIIQPLKQLITVPYGKFMATRQISKLLDPAKWFTPPEFNWSILKPSNEATNFEVFSQSNCFLIAVDIETFRENAVIRCIGYTAFFYDSKEPSGIHSESIVLPLEDDWSLAAMRRFNWELKAPKVFQNGKYDCSYLARYNAPCYNYLYDTANMFHSWYSELPKDLGFLNAFFIREAVYHKDLAKTNDLYEYYRYNALDTWATGNCLLAMILELPVWAKNNYLLEFPLTFPCHLAEMTGITRDETKLAGARKAADDKIAQLGNRLDVILGVKNFNVKSPKQMKQLLRILGCSDLPSADAKSLVKARYRHPFNAKVIGLVLSIRAARTLKEKYLHIGADAKEFKRLDGTGNQILYSLNPHGTDTSRLASREHHFWCGLQVQNIPRGDSVKCTLRASEGFYIAEVDLEQAESRDTAYISGDATLIENVENSPDFHSANASAFFGVPFEKIYDVSKKLVIDKPLRTLAKPVNHGANYNMGAVVLVDTMGEENIVRAKGLLHLPYDWSYRNVAQHLLDCFHKTYPDIREVFYKGVVQDVMATGMLVHKVANQDEAWSRYCFGNPIKSKRNLNAYIAHLPQALNAQTLNKAWLKVFHEIAIHPDHSANFKLCAQIHDSILFQYRIGHSYLCQMVKELMEIPVTITAYDGVTRTFTVPAGIKAGKSGKEATYWSEVE